MKGGRIAFHGFSRGLPVREYSMAKTQIASEKTLNDIKGIVTKINNKLAAAGNMGALPHVEFEAPAHSTVTATDGTTVITATEVNGVFQFDVPHFGDWEISTTRGSRTEKQTLSVTQVKSYQVSSALGHRYGYRIDRNLYSMYEQKTQNVYVEYLYDAVGLKPAKMDFNTGVFDYGDWGDKWFITENKPCMLKSNGTIDYYLDPNDYSKKEDGTPSDVANTNYDGNAMSLIPLVWVKRYEDNDYVYEIISDIQYDDDYKAYAHTRADGTIADWFAWSIYGNTGPTSKLRSLSGQETHPESDGSFTFEHHFSAAKANGSLWNVHSWSQRELIRTLLFLISRSMDTPLMFGYGYCMNKAVEDASPWWDGVFLTTGTLDDKGQFFGYNDTSHQVKVFHIERFWGEQCDQPAGFLAKSVKENGVDYGKVYVKMTPEGNGYSADDLTGYTEINTNLFTGSRMYPWNEKLNCSENGLIPQNCGLFKENKNIPFSCLAAGGFATIISASQDLNTALTNGNPRSTVLEGAFTYYMVYTSDLHYMYIGCGLSCEQPV